MSEEKPLPRFSINHKVLAPFDSISSIIGEVGISFTDTAIRVCGKNCESNFIFTWTIDGYDFTPFRTEGVYVGVEPAVLKVAIGKMTKVQPIEMQVVLNHDAMAVRDAEHEPVEGANPEIFAVQVVDKFGGVKSCESLDVENFQIVDFGAERALMRPMSVEHLHATVDSITPMKIGFVECEGNPENRHGTQFHVRAIGHGITEAHTLVTQDGDPFVGDALSAYYYLPHFKCLTKMFNAALTPHFLFRWVGEVLMFEYALKFEPLTSTLRILVAPTEKSHIPKIVRKRRNLRAKTPEPKRTLREKSEWDAFTPKEDAERLVEERIRRQLEEERAQEAQYDEDELPEYDEEYADFEE